MMELIAGLRELALLGKAVMKDGKIDLTDLPQMMVLLQKQQVLLGAFTGLADVVAEVKDLSADEVLEVVTAIVQAAKDVKAA